MINYDDTYDKLVETLNSREIGLPLYNLYRDIEDGAETLARIYEDIKRNGEVNSKDLRNFVSEMKGIQPNCLDGLGMWLGMDFRGERVRGLRALKADRGSWGLDLSFFLARLHRNSEKLKKSMDMISELVSQKRKKKIVVSFGDENKKDVAGHKEELESFLKLLKKLKIEKRFEALMNEIESRGMDGASMVTMLTFLKNIESGLARTKRNEGFVKSYNLRMNNFRKALKDNIIEKMKGGTDYEPGKEIALESWRDRQ